MRPYINCTLNIKLFSLIIEILYSILINSNQYRQSGNLTSI